MVGVGHSARNIRECAHVAQTLNVVVVGHSVRNTRYCARVAQIQSAGEGVHCVRSIRWCALNAQIQTVVVVAIGAFTKNINFFAEFALTADMELSRYSVASAQMGADFFALHAPGNVPL